MVHVHCAPTIVPGKSPRSLTKGATMPRDCSVAVWARRILEAATIFIAFVIFWMFWTDFIRCLTVRSQGLIHAALTRAHSPRTCLQVGKPNEYVLAGPVRTCRVCKWTDEHPLPSRGIGALSHARTPVLFRWPLR